ncbi:flagellar basal body-associated FliL family protein [Chengkuizengella axinellae]|uniref:Flagellar protein FliL n=1 Tax=Chengkuizengella axinellae TaxID=3064388 RepID=A0ABT9IW14_9BACL|nr:flagellar basal body-associated FliL family protein [Chengkuizengella sp. 2205SS18-9]MDP5273448.1 flagellar basal body-associated FliL family protein [Chengkuizengella sp. 2205SS18-9]
MSKNLLFSLIFILVFITLIILSAFIFWDWLKSEPPSNVNPTAQEIQSLTVFMDDVTTNLADLNYLIRLSLAFELDNEAAKEEFKASIHIVESNIIRVLADTKSDEINDSQDLDVFINKLKDIINPILTEGTLKQIHITDRVVSRI